ncbi:unnamed protein product [Spirodela intermedia]|uniref:Uncharacterized protein n=1 Tax=Spirodela intermedia TaxID=51605 RepID=A0A7I8LH25_SPIIN|nr:unnamed protein product [Spirodela intermedia]
MDWWEKAVLPPVKRAWVAVAAAAASRAKPGTGIEKLEDDVQTCEYEDVQVMWEMLRTEMEISSQRPKRRRAPLAKAFVWFDRPAAPPPAHGGLCTEPRGGRPEKREVRRRRPLRRPLPPQVNHHHRRRRRRLPSCIDALSLSIGS